MRARDNGNKPDGNVNKRWFRWGIIVLGVLALAAVAGVAGGYYYGLHSLKLQAVQGSDSGYSNDERTLDDKISYQGKTYVRNRDIYTVLCMGLDTENDMSEAGGASGSGAQSDANFLAIIDKKQKKIRLVAIPRDTMTDLETFYMTGEPLGLLRDHLALQYAFGNGGIESCKLMERAVSRLFYDFPVDAYVAFSLNSIENLKGMVGGVTVEIQQDFDDFKAGDTVTLNNEQAYHFIRWRDCEEAYSAQYRLQRQKQYLVAFIEKAMTATKQDMRTPFRMYNSISDSMLMDLSKAQMMSLVMLGLNCDFTEEDLLVIPGEQVQGQYYEEFHIDEQAFYELMLELFYTAEDA